MHDVPGGHLDLLPAQGRHAANSVELGCAAMVASGVLMLKTGDVRRRPEGEGKGRRKAKEKHQTV